MNWRKIWAQKNRRHNALETLLFRECFLEKGEPCALCPDLPLLSLCGGFGAAWCCHLEVGSGHYSIPICSSSPSSGRFQGPSSVFGFTTEGWSFLGTSSVKTRQEQSET